MRLQGRTILISGSARGQGAAQARLLAREGAGVAIADVLTERGEALAEELSAEGPAVRFFPLDVTREEDWGRTVAGIEAWRGRLDGLVNNAGIIRRTGIMDTSRESFEAVMAVNLTGAFLGIRAAAPAMIRAGGGTVVNISSNAAFAYHPDVAYTASKWALRGLTRSAAMEFAEHGIRVNAVCPGLVVTELNETSPHLPIYSRMVPMGRTGTPEEMARLVLFLTSDDSSYVTGEDFVADGGFNAGAAVRRVAEDLRGA